MGNGSSQVSVWAYKMIDDLSEVYIHTDPRVLPANDTVTKIPGFIRGGLNHLKPYPAGSRFAGYMNETSGEAVSGTGNISVEPSEVTLNGQAAAARAFLKAARMEKDRCEHFGLSSPCPQ